MPPKIKCKASQESNDSKKRKTEEKEKEEKKEQENKREEEDDDELENEDGEGIIFYIHFSNYLVYFYAFKTPRLFIIQPFNPSEVPQTVNAFPEYFIWQPNPKSHIKRDIHEAMDLNGYTKEELLSILELIKCLLLPEEANEYTYPLIYIPTKEERNSAESKLKKFFPDYQKKKDLGIWEFVSNEELYRIDSQEAFIVKVLFDEKRTSL